MVVLNMALDIKNTKTPNNVRNENASTRATFVESRSSISHDGRHTVWRIIDPYVLVLKSSRLIIQLQWCCGKWFAERHLGC